MMTIHTCIPLLNKKKITQHLKNLPSTYPEKMCRHVSVVYFGSLSKLLPGVYFLNAPSLSNLSTHQQQRKIEYLLKKPVTQSSRSEPIGDVLKRRCKRIKNSVGDMVVTMTRWKTQ